MVATPSEHYARADELLASLYQMDATLRERFGDEPMAVPVEVTDFLHDQREYTLGLAQVHALLAGVPPVVAQFSDQEQRKEREAALWRQYTKDVPQA